MARGQLSDLGTTRVSANGYSYTKTEEGWRLTHHVIAEKKLGRKIKENELVRFVGSKRDLRPENIVVVPKGTTTIRRRIAHIEARIEELQAELAQLKKQL